MNVCIVDDDKYVVEKIVEGIDWKKRGIEEVYTAFNIKQAKEILSMLPVDILLSDIEMPQGSGLELLEWVREQKLSVECIYLSSYAHFAYAQKALELHSRGYLLKPVSNRELEHVLEGLVGQIRLTKNESGKSIQEKKESYWRDFLNREDKEVRESYGQEPLTLSMLRIFRGIEHRSIQGDAVLVPTLRHMTETFMAENGYTLDAMVRYSDNCFLLVIPGGAKGREALKNQMHRLLLRIEEELCTKACIYMGKPAQIEVCREKMHSLADMMREGIACKEGLLFEEEWRGRSAVYVPPDFAMWEQKIMRQKDLDEVSAWFIDYVTALWEGGRANVTVFGCFKSDLQQMISHYMMENNILMNQIFEVDEFEYYYDKASWTLRDMQEFIRVLFRKLKAVNTVEDTEENVVEQIVRYIEDNLSGDLSRANLASRAYISEDYLSKKFAVYTGMSIPNYVSARRMEKAQEYFRNTALSVSEVASLVGYTNFSYFSKTFKDYAGCTPNEYRNRYNRNV